MNTVAKQTIETRVLSMKDIEADKWLSDLMIWIKKNHPHLERRWWEKMQTKHSRYLHTTLKE